MLALLIVLFVVGGVIHLVTTPEERARALAIGTDALDPIRIEFARAQVATAPFREALRARTPWAIVAPAIFAINGAIFMAVLFTDGPVDAPATLLAWGASAGARTSNGEWWRLLTATFVHGSVLHVLATCAGLAQLGRMLERLVGSVTFAGVYVVAGAFANLASLAEAPLAIQSGATGAIFGAYGLLFAVIGWGLHRNVGLRIPLVAFRSLAPTAVVFFLYTAVTSGVASRPNLTGLTVGVVTGLALTRRVGERRTEVLSAARVLGAAAVVLIACAVPLRGLVDVGPQIAEVFAIEERTNAPYKEAVASYRKGRTDVKALTTLITGTIVPQINEARRRVEALDGVMVEHQPLVADAQEYLRLRETSWQLRVKALRAGSMQTLREADNAERASLGALERLRRGQRALELRVRLRSAGA